MLLKLALKQLFFDRMMALCQIAALASLMAPLLLLFSLRYGILNEMEQKLLNDPGVLSLTLDTSYRLDDKFFQDLKKQPQTGWVMPEITALNALVDLKFAGMAKKVSVQPTAPGDPVVLGSGIEFSAAEQALADNEVFLSEGLASLRNLHVGNKVMMVVSRIRNMERQSVMVPLTIRGLIKERFVHDDVGLLTMNMIQAIDDYRSGFEPELLSDGSREREGNRYYAKFRLYATDLDSVIPLYHYLTSRHLNVRSKVREIENVSAIARVLNFIFGVVAAVSITGGALALSGLILSALRARKRNMVLLRLMGSSAIDTYKLAALDALIIATVGFALALGLYLAGSHVFNRYFIEMLSGAVISTLTWTHVAVFYLGTILLAEIISLIAAHLILMRAHIADILRES